MGSLSKVALDWSGLIGKLCLCGEYLHQANVAQRYSAFLKSQVFVFPNPCFKTHCLYPGGNYCTSRCGPPGSESLTLSNLHFSSPHFSLVVGVDNRSFILIPSISFLSLLLTKYPAPPQKSVRLEHLLRGFFVLSQLLQLGKYFILTERD